MSYIGFFWAPTEKANDVRECLAEFSSTEFQEWHYGNGHDLMPPTMFQSNDVIAPLQLITNTYGVPTYGEANPATFAIVTFPFLFAVMFGDYGHGSLLLFMGTMLVLFNDTL